MKGQKIIFPAIVSVVFVSLIFVLNYSSIYADDSIIDVQLAVPVTNGFLNPFDTQKGIGEFGENTEILLTSHSDPVFDRSIVRAEHKLQSDIADAVAKRAAADTARAEADADPENAKLERKAVRLEGQADKAEAGQCAMALKQQAGLARKGKVSQEINDYIAANSC